MMASCSMLGTRVYIREDVPAERALARHRRQRSAIRLTAPETYDGARRDESGHRLAAPLDGLLALRLELVEQSLDRDANPRRLLLNHLVGELQQRLRDRNSERFGGLEIYHQLEFRGLLDG